MLPRPLWLLCLAAISARALDTTDYVSVTGTFSTLSTVPTSDFTGSQYVYITETTQSTVTSLLLINGTSSTATSTGTGTSATDTGDVQSTRIENSQTQIVIGGGTHTSTGNSTASSTSTSASATNTVPCNNYPEFCNRKYSNITEVCAHNSAFVVKNNAASNQQLPVTDQLDDGVRMLQGETHWVNDTVYNCHTSCDLLNVGPWQDELETLVTWLESNPYDVVTFLIVNSDFVDVTNYVSAVENSGLINYVYEPAYVPQHRDQWPTLGEMILSGKRVVLFMDYKANQTAVPYILDEFTHMFETPFSPTNRSFPCTEQRPPGLNTTLAKENYMYLANHNLNTAVDLSALLGGSSEETILIPNTAEINITNGAYDQYSQLEAMSQNCTIDWERPPNFLLVDYYNLGVPHPGSVFEVAARANGVTYNRKCCGATTSAARMIRGSCAALAVAMIFAALLAW
ncbi:putative secreted protein [Teratosphaeria destructans]|uniref:Secreted protein n=1 Tax=Teratosphaeria destructans TaxID=418781 RepID=A0A9W7SK15_9PEZI|nr:putative secreted protein [Teratosphaeria destructans]